RGVGVWRAIEVGPAGTRSAGLEVPVGIVGEVGPLAHVAELLERLHLHMAIEHAGDGLAEVAAINIAPPVRRRGRIPGVAGVPSLRAVAARKHVGCVAAAATERGRLGRAGDPEAGPDDAA